MKAEITEANLAHVSKIVGNWVGVNKGLENMCMISIRASEWMSNSPESSGAQAKRSKAKFFGVGVCSLIMLLAHVVSNLVIGVVFNQVRITGMLRYGCARPWLRARSSEISLFICNKKTKKLFWAKENHVIKWYRTGPGQTPELAQCLWPRIPV